jgi:dinuclear metal center YbgI/SA1388 family protein
MNKPHRIPLPRVVHYCDRHLQTLAIADWPGAANGLQVENRRGVSRLAAAVDASLATVRMAIDAGADLLLVHHGLFWTPRQPWTGPNYRLLRLLVEHDLAVYSAHLPLDVHPRWGNNARLCAALGFKKCQPFFFEQGLHVGLRTLTSRDRQDMSRCLQRVLGQPPRLLPGGPPICRHIGVVTGGAGDQLSLAAQEGVDTLITGEGKHWTYALAEELGINVFYGGHYATETFGVKALSTHLARHFRLDHIFLDHPTGL